MTVTNNQIEKRLWDAADELRANSKFKASEYAVPVLGLIFLRYADHKFSVAGAEITPLQSPLIESGKWPTSTYPGAGSSACTAFNY